MFTLSVVIPVKDERDNLRPLHDRLRRALDPLVGARLSDYELLFVDDGSVDGSPEVLADLATLDRRVKVIVLRRNYGQTPALRAGIDLSCGDVLVTMDGDLQNDPADVPMLLDRLSEGYDAVFGLRKNRQDKLFIRKLPSFAGNWLIRKVTGVTVKDMGCTLRVMRRETAKALPLYGELHRFVPVLARMHGARITQVDVNHRPRVAGRTKYNLTRTFRVLLDLITVKFLADYRTKPMYLFGGTGLLLSSAGVVLAGVPLWQKLFYSVWVHRNPLLLIAVFLFSLGVNLFLMGLLAEMAIRTYHESQCKPIYHVRRRRNLGTL